MASYPMRIRARAKDGVADIKVLIEHPMETGLRKDASGKLVPIHFIQNVVATCNGKTVLNAQWSQAISKNPFLGFKIKGGKPGDKVNVSWVDNEGMKGSIDATIEKA